MRLFYSWQSDVPQNRKLLSRCLTQVSEVTGIEIETATRDASGSPDIASSILMKIDGSDMFLADVSIINPDADGRKTPNPNVMYELGYALKALGEESIILVANRDTTDTVHLPFDIRNRRMVLVSLSTPDAKKQIMQAITTATGLVKPKVNQPLPPKIIFLEEQVKWANWSTSRGAFCGFKVMVSMDNYHGELDYITGVVLEATDAEGDAWRTQEYRIGRDNFNNKLYAVAPNSMEELEVLLSDSPQPARRMPDIDRDSARIVFSFRSGKTEVLSIKPADLVQD